MHLSLVFIIIFHFFKIATTINVVVFTISKYFLLLNFFLFQIYMPHISLPYPEVFCFCLFFQADSVINLGIYLIGKVNCIRLWKLRSLWRAIFQSSMMAQYYICLLYTSPSPRDRTRSRMPSSA